MVIDGLDIFYPPYPYQFVVDVYQNVKHVFGVCIYCPHFDILWFDIILHSVHSCRGFYFPKLNMSWMQEDVKHWGYGQLALLRKKLVIPRIKLILILEMTRLKSLLPRLKLDMTRIKLVLPRIKLILPRLKLVLSRIKLELPRLNWNFEEEKKQKKTWPQYASGAVAT